MSTIVAVITDQMVVVVDRGVPTAHIAHAIQACQTAARDAAAVHVQRMAQQLRRAVGSGAIAAPVWLHAGLVQRGLARLARQSPAMSESLAASAATQGWEASALARAVQRLAATYDLAEMRLDALFAQSDAVIRAAVAPIWQRSRQQLVRWLLNGTGISSARAAPGEVILLIAQEGERWEMSDHWRVRRIDAAQHATPWTPLLPGILPGVQALEDWLDAVSFDLSIAGVAGLVTSLPPPPPEEDQAASAADQR